MKTIYYRPERDRKYISEDVNKVIDYMVNKRNLTEQQRQELIDFGTTQDEKHGIKSFTFRSITNKGNYEKISSY